MEGLDRAYWSHVALTFAKIEFHAMTATVAYTAFIFILNLFPPGLAPIVALVSPVIGEGVLSPVNGGVVLFILFNTVIVAALARNHLDSRRQFTAQR